jgi:hypothetical protein
MTAPARETLFTVTGQLPEGGRQVVYEGPDRQTAVTVQGQQRRLGRLAGVVLTARTEYPPPERNPLCKCRGMPGQQQVCPFGHHTLCHWPLECGAAGCGRAQDGNVPLWLAARVLAEDVVFTDSPDEGPACTCSRCRRPVLSHVIRLWEPGAAGRLERRYHPGCLGLPTPEDVGNDA